MKILLALVLPLLWNVSTVIYLTHQARKGMLSLIKFSFIFILSLSIIVSTIVFIAITNTNGISIREIGFTMFVLLLHLVIGFPVVYFLSGFLLEKHFVEWGSKIKANKKK